MIAAMADQRVIGMDNAMPWHLPADLAWFKKNTLNKPIVMGRKTFDSIGKPLPNRRNIVLTRNLDHKIEGCELFDSPESILEATADDPEVMITGGAQLYQLFLPLADRLFLTFIDASPEGDTFFPNYESMSWKETFNEKHAADEKNSHPYTFVILDRIR